MKKFVHLQAFIQTRHNPAAADLRACAYYYVYSLARAGPE